MQLYLLPLDVVERGGARYRVPPYLRSRFGQGLDLRWSLKDFGHTSTHALVVTEGQIPAVASLPMEDRGRLGGMLREAGVEAAWVLKAETPRERIHRLMGMAFAMQSGEDDPYSTVEMQDPSVWLGREILFGLGRLDPLDLESYAREQDALRRRIIDPLRVRWERKPPRWDWRAALRQMALMPLNILMGALPATDAFTGTTMTALTTYSSSWSLNHGNFKISSNALAPNAIADMSLAFWNADAFDANQYSKATYVSGSNDSSGAAIGVGVRHAGSGTWTGYIYYWDLRYGRFLDKFVGGTYTELGATSNTPTAGQAIELQANGTTLTPRKNNSTDSDIGAQTDSSISSGSAGVSGYSNNLTDTIDTWEGGNLSGGAVNLTGVGNIASAETFGTALARLNVTPTGVASAETFGTQSAGANLTSLTGIASAEAIGTPVVGGTLAPAGIVSVEAFGVPTLSVNVANGGTIPSGEAAGSQSIQAGLAGAGGIAGAEAFGTPVVTLAVNPASVESGEAFGDSALSVDVAGAGNIASAEAFGTANVSTTAPVNLTDAGNIAGAEALGMPVVTLAVNPSSVGSGEAFGNPALSVDVAGAGGIAGAEVFGTPSVTTTSPINLTNAGNIASVEAFGMPGLALRIESGGIASSELFGETTFVMLIAPMGIAGSEAFGIAIVGDAVPVYEPVLRTRERDQVIGVRTRNLR